MNYINSKNSIGLGQAHASSKTILKCLVVSVAIHNCPRSTVYALIAIARSHKIVVLVWTSISTHTSMAACVSLLMLFPNLLQASQR